MYPTHIPPGTEGLVTVQVYNIGAGGSKGTVTLTDVLPPGLEAISAENMEGSGNFIPKEEVEEWRAKYDPIDSLRALILKEKAAGEDDLKTIEREIKDIVTDCAEFSQTSPEPDPSELWTDVLKD